MEKHNLCVNGQKIQTVRTWCKFFFGEFLERIEADLIKRKFHIFVKEKIKSEDGSIIEIDDMFDLQEFMDFWSPGFIVIKVRYQL